VVLRLRADACTLRVKGVMGVVNFSPRALFFLPLALLLLVPFSHAQNAPLVYWHNHPVQPNATVLVFGAGLSNAIVNLCDNSVCIVFSFSLFLYCLFRT
jgi:hypothetical protein